MTRILILTMTALVLSACDSGGGGNGSPLPGEGNGKTEQNIPAWDELDCQQDKNCADPILNFTRARLVSLLGGSFTTPSELDADDSNRNIFDCGIKVYDFWNELTPELLKGNEPHFLNFSQKLLNLETCTLKPDLIDLLNNYLTESEDYKNETE